MKCIVYDAWGGPDRLHLVDLPTSEPAAGEVTVALAYAGVNPADWKFLSGRYRIIAKGGFPRRIGFEGAGTISAVGKGARLAIGTRVVVSHGPENARLGTLGQTLTLPESNVQPLPASIDTRDAAVLPVAAATALTMCNICGVKAQSRVLVVGASGGVGLFATQIAKARGAHVTAVASARNENLVMSIGADAFIDYRQTPIEQAHGTWDAILDCVNAVRPHAMRLLASGGHYADTDPLPLVMLRDVIGNLFRSRKMHTVINNSGDPATMPGKLASLLEMIEKGQLRVIVGHEFPLEQATEAYRLSLSGRAAGKIVIRIDQA